MAIETIDTGSDPAKSIQHGCCGKKSNPILDAILELCEKIEGLTGVDLQPLCDKIEALIDIMSEANFAELCAKLLSVVESLETLCAKIEEGNTKMCDKLDAIASAISALEAQLTVITNAITGLETQLTNIATAVNANGDLLEKICTKLDGIQAAIVAMQQALLLELQSQTTCLNAIKAALVNEEGESLISKMCDIRDFLESVMTKAPCVVGADAGGEPVGEPYEYVLDGDNTDFFISNGELGYSGNAVLTANASAFYDVINKCLSDGNDMLITHSGSQGGGTFVLAAADNGPTVGPGNPGIASAITGQDPAKFSQATLQCVSTDGEPTGEAEIVLGVTDKCAYEKLCAILDAIKNQQDGSTGAIEECCTGGAIPGVTDICLNVPLSNMSGTVPEGCNLQINGVEMPTNYTQADYLAALNPGHTIEIEGDNATIYANSGIVTRTTCFNGGEGGLVGSISTTAITGLANTTEPECVNFQRTWDKWSEPTANLIATGNAIANEQLAKQCSMEEKLCNLEEMASDAAIKDCLLYDFWTNCNDEAPVIPEGLVVDEEGTGTVTVEGDVGEQYPAGTSVAIYDAQGNIIGSAEATGENTYDAETNQTVIGVTGAELTAGATATQVATVKPVANIVKPAVVASVKGVKILDAKRSLATTEPLVGEKETPTRG